MGPASNVRKKAGAIMARVRLSSWIKEMHGKVGDVVFRSSQSGETYVSKSPDMSTVEWSPAQNAQRQRPAPPSTATILSCRVTMDFIP